MVATQSSPRANVYELEDFYLTQFLMITKILRRVVMFSRLTRPTTRPTFPSRTIPSPSHATDLIMRILKPASNGLKHLKWHKPPQNIYISKKDYDPVVLNAAKSFISHLQSAYNANIFVDAGCHTQMKNTNILQPQDPIDLVVTMGGDGTILRAASKFMNTHVPPILSLSMGTLGFLLPFDFNEAKQAFDDVYKGNSLVMNRSRLSVKLHNHRVHAMNDLTIYRGSSPHLAQMDIKVNGDFVTTAIADGITVATPTGSTAYSLSAGGSIVHPNVPCILLTPICPRSLSFRPLIFPSDSTISILVGKHSRGPNEISVDGSDMGELNHGDSVDISINPDDGVWCVARDCDDWVHNLNGLLRFNSKFGRDED